MDLKIPYEEGELIALLKQKDYQAFNNLYDKYAPALYTLVLQIVKNKEIGNDVLQKVFIVIWCTIDKYEPAKGNLFTWMLQIARNTAINEINSSNYQKALKQASITGEEALPSLTEPGIDNFGFKKVTDNLEEEHKTLMELYYYKGFTIEQIAETLSITEDTVKTRIRTALSELRNLLCKK